MSVISRKYFHDEKAAFDHLEAVLWPDGPICPHCGTVGRAGKLDGVRGKNGKVRLGLWKCYEKECRKQFTVRIGTVFECAHVPLPKMLQAVYLMCSSKKGISAHQMHRSLEVSYKTAWFLEHRIREAMRPDIYPPMGGEGHVVEADETYIGSREGQSIKTLRRAGRERRGGHFKNIVLTLVERGGSARSFHVDSTSVAQIAPILRENASRKSRLMTDEANQYKEVGREYASHESVNHSQEDWARGDAHTNSVEGFYSIFKRGMKGIYQHCSEKHLHRYLAEFDFRYSNRVRLGVDDQARTARALRGIVCKRLTYRGPASIGP
jgi:transposase-like protein